MQDREEKEDYTEYFDCQCNCTEHVLRFIYMGAFKDEEPELYLDIFLDNRTFLRRLWVGVKYIFGRKSSYGHFDNWTMKVEDAKKFRNMVDRFEKETKEFNEKEERERNEKRL